MLFKTNSCVCCKFHPSLTFEVKAGAYSCGVLNHKLRYLHVKIPKFWSSNLPRKKEYLKVRNKKILDSVLNCHSFHQKIELTKRGRIGGGERGRGKKGGGIFSFCFLREWILKEFLIWIFSLGIQPLSWKVFLLKALSNLWASICKNLLMNFLPLVFEYWGLPRETSMGWHLQKLSQTYDQYFNIEPYQEAF